MRSKDGRHRSRPIARTLPGLALVSLVGGCSAISTRSTASLSAPPVIVSGSRAKLYATADRLAADSDLVVRAAVEGFGPPTQSSDGTAVGSTRIATIAVVKGREPNAHISVVQYMHGSFESVSLRPGGEYLLFLRRSEDITDEGRPGYFVTGVAAGAFEYRPGEEVPVSLDDVTRGSIPFVDGATIDRIRALG